MDTLISSSQGSEETLKMFKTWTKQKLRKSNASITTKKAKLATYITVASDLKKNLMQEIWECNEAELDSGNGVKFRTSKTLLSRFYSYIQTKKNVQKSTLILTKKNQQRRRRKRKAKGKV